MGGYHDKAPAGQGTALRVMRTKLMNCPVNYEDPEEIKCKPIVKQPISAGKMVTWKSEVAAPFRAPQECVGQNRILVKKPRTDRQVSRTRCTCGDTGGHNATVLRSARLIRRSWKLG